MFNKPIIYKFFKYFVNLWKKTNMVVVFGHRPFPTFLNTRTVEKTFQQSVKKDSVRHTVKSSTSMYESSVPHFLRTTTGKESRSDVFDKTRLVVTLLTNLRLAEILCIFRLVLDGKAGKELTESSRLEYSKNF